MKLKIALTILVIIFSLAVFMDLSSAKTQVIQLENRGLVIEYPKVSNLEQNEPYTWHWRVYNTTDGLVKSTENTDCDFGIQSVDGDDRGSFVVFSKNVSYNTTTETFFYHTNGGNFSSLGEYTLTIECRELSANDPQDILQGGFVSFPFEVTPTGEILTTSQGTLYIGIIILSLIVFGLMLTGAIKIPWKHKRDNDGFIVEKADLKYVKLILWFTSYLMAIFIAFLIEHVSGSYLRLDIASNIFGAIFWLLVSFLFPIFVITWIIGIYHYVKDWKIFTAMERGVKPRE